MEVTVVLLTPLIRVLVTTIYYTSIVHQIVSGILNSLRPHNPLEGRFYYPILQLRLRNITFSKFQRKHRILGDEKCIYSNPLFYVPKRGELTYLSNGGYMFILKA